MGELLTSREVLVHTWSELVARAGSPDKARLLLRDAVYRRVLHDAYVLADEPDDVVTRLAALRRVVPAHCALSHWSSLWVCGADVLPRDREGRDLLDITVPRGLRLQKRPGLRTHSALATDLDLVQAGGLLLHSAARAVVDVARTYGMVEGVAAGDAALRGGDTTTDRIEEAVDRAGGLRWVSRAREMVPHLDGRSESLPESRLRVGVVLEGGPRMAAQVDLYDEDGHHCGRCDLYEEGVDLEYDGFELRQLQPVFTRDRRRGNDISSLAVEVRRFVSDDMAPSRSRWRWGVVREALDLASRRERPRLRYGRDTLRPPKRTPLPTVAEGQARRTA